MEPSFVAPAFATTRRSACALARDGLRRPGGRRAVGVLAVVLMLAGVALFAYPLGTDLYQHHVQDQLRHSFAAPQTAQAYRTRTFMPGQSVTRIRISRISLDVVVVEGTDEAALQAGAGHYLGTPLPGETGNVGIAGHRTTYGHPFNRLDEVRPGDLIELDTPTAEYFYRSVSAFDGQVNPHPVSPSDVAVIAAPIDPATHELTLTTCNPKGSARQRLILRALLVSSRALPGETVHDSAAPAAPDAPQSAPAGPQSAGPALTTLPAPT